MRVLADEKKITAMVSELATAIQRDVSRSKTPAPWALVGIRSRGDVLAQRLAKLLTPDHVGSLDITLYRDDLSEIGPQPIVRTTDINFDVDGLNVVLVDDVLMSGRSVRAALQSLMDFGRPQRVWLSVLVDRGGRELPICPDHVVLNVAGQVSAGDLVDVKLMPYDDTDQIVVRTREK